MESGASAHALASIVEMGEAHALADLFAAAPAVMAAQWGLSATRIGSATVGLCRRLNFPLLNRTIGLGIGVPATEAMLDDVLAIYARAGVLALIQLSPEARPAALPEWLAARGLQAEDRWAKCYRGPDPPPAVSTDLRLTVAGPGDAATFSATAQAGFGFPAGPGGPPPVFAAAIGRPGWRHYLAWDGDTAAAIGVLYLEDGIASLFGGATLPAYRRRGAQGALMAIRIRDAIAAGCRWIVTETGEDTRENPNPSFHNMLRTGFHLAYLRPNYVFHPAASLEPMGDSPS